MLQKKSYYGDSDSGHHSHGLPYTSQLLTASVPSTPQSLTSYLSVPNMSCSTFTYPPCQVLQLKPKVMESPTTVIKVFPLATGSAVHVAGKGRRALARGCCCCSCSVQPTRRKRMKRMWTLDVVDISVLLEMALLAYDSSRLWFMSHL